jgi:MYXO-CTERM domain-containing protein
VTVATIGDAPVDRAESGGGCAAGGTGSALLGLLGAAGALAWRRRRRVTTVLAALLLVGSLAVTPGCNCGNGTNPIQDDAAVDPDPVYTHGAIGRHASLVAAPDGQLWVAAYEENYGDLVIGAIGAAPDFEIKWEIIDGVPADARTKGDPNGWRYGIKDNGANVGFYNSLIVGPDGKLRIAYREATAAYRSDPAVFQLKYAVKSKDTCDKSWECWTPHVVDANGLAGYYANLTWSAEGVPTIAYMAPGQVDATTGRVTAELRFAVAKSATPAAAEDWTITVVDKQRVSCGGMCGAEQGCVASKLVCATVDATGCSTACAADHACVAGQCVAKATTACPGTCASPQVCVTEENLCVTSDTAACSATPCSDTQVCVAGACVDTVAAPQVVDIPKGLGLWVKTVRDSFGRPVLVYYDRANGDLKRAMVVGAGTWSIKAIDTDGDVGQFPSALIDATDNLHVAYTEAAKGQLIYLKTTLSDNATPTREVVDNGMSSTDGPHKVGAETQLALDATAQLHILYQDQRVSALMHATKTSGSTTWTTAPARQDTKAGYGFFTRLVSTSSGFYFVDYRYDRIDTPTGEITDPVEAVKARPHAVAEKGNTFGWLEVGSM